MLRFALLCLAVIGSTLAVTPVNLNAATRRAFVDAHNAARTPLGLPTLAWDSGLANYARTHAGKCVWEHSHGPHGENLAMSKPLKTDTVAIAKQHVKMWIDEKAIHDRTHDWSCMTSGCGHYTQVVWRTTKKVGCAIAHCPNLPNYTVCEYDPPGNYRGRDPY